jgi:hypothetical protein
MCVGIGAGLVACTDPLNSLAVSLMGVMLNEERIAPVVTKFPKFFRERHLYAETKQEQNARLTGDITAVKTENDLG